MRKNPCRRFAGLASFCACFALGPDDGLLYTNGFTVWHLSPGAATPAVVHRGKLIQALAAVS